MEAIVFDTINPVNLLLLFTNIFAFIVMETTFFWFVTSEAVNDILAEKAGLVSTFAKQNPINEAAMRMYLESENNVDVIPSIASEQFKGRQDINWELVKSYIVPIATGVGGLIFILLGLMVVRRQPLSRIDMFLLVLVFCAFLTEMYFYITVTKQIVYIGDSSVLYHMYKASTRALNGEGPPERPQ